MDKYTEDEFNEVFYKLIQEQKNKFYMIDRVCSYCRCLVKGDACLSCGAPQEGYTPSDIHISKLRVKAHILLGNNKLRKEDYERF